MRLADLHRAVQSTLASKRLGAPVFVRYLLETTDKANAIAPRLAQLAAAIRDWLGQAPQRLYALGSTKAGHVSLTIEFQGGATALLAWSSGARGAVDLTVLGNHGALYHDAGTADLWDESIAGLEDKPDAQLVAWIERALRTGRPETAEK